MPDKTQTRASHTRFDPGFHFSLIPATAILFVWTVVITVRHPNTTSLIEAFIALLLFLAIFKTRLYSLKVQDRVIRLEERLRLAALLPEASRARISEFTIPQLVALRFASDAELPSLATRTLTENLTSSQIKDAIQNWRPDHFRV